MIQAEVSRLQRSYERNLGWCRFWLGVGLAVVTLTFTLAVDQVFFTNAELIPITAGALNDTGSIVQADSTDLTGIAVVCSLVFLAAACASLSALFRILYLRNDAALTAITANQEATQ